MAEDKDNEQLNLKVVGQDGQVIAFKIKRNTPFRKLIHAYCDRAKVAQNTMRFTFDGSRINDNDTPKSMDMEDGDTIEVFTQQTGGSGLLMTLPRPSPSKTHQEAVYQLYCKRTENRVLRTIQ